MFKVQTGDFGYVFQEYTPVNEQFAGWKIHHFHGIYQERWGFSWAMLVYRRVPLAKTT